MLVNFITWPTCSISKHSLLKAKKVTLHKLNHIELCWKIGWDWAGLARRRPLHLQRIYRSFPQRGPEYTKVVYTLARRCFRVFRTVCSCLGVCCNAPTSDFYPLIPDSLSKYDHWLYNHTLHCSPPLSCPKPLCFRRYRHSSLPRSSQDTLASSAPSLVCKSMDSSAQSWKSGVVP